MENKKRKFDDYDLGYEAGYLHAMKEMKEGLDLEEQKLIQIQYNNELFRSMLFNKLKKKARIFEFNDIEAPEDYEECIPVGGQSSAEEDSKVKKYFFASKKDDSVVYIAYLGLNEDLEPEFNLEVVGLKHLKGEIKTFKSLATLVTYASNVEKVVDTVEYLDDEDFED